MMDSSAEIWLTITNALLATAVCSAVVFLTGLALCSLSQITPAVRCSLFRIATVVGVFPLCLIFLPVAGTSSTGGRAESAMAVQQPLVHPPSVQPFRQEIAETVASGPTDLTHGNDASSERGRTGFEPTDTKLKRPTVVNLHESEERSTASAGFEVAATSTSISLDKPNRRSWRVSPQSGRAIAVTWIVVTVTLLLRPLLGVVVGIRYWRRHLRPADCMVASGLSVSRSIRTAFNESVVVPIVVGILRPIIVIPVELRDASPASLQMVMQHELNHIRRHDIFWNILINLIVAVIWFQPLAWVVRHRHRMEQENACDDAVLGHGHRAHEYALLLTELAQAAKTRMLAGYSFVSMAGRRPIEQRIHLILDSTRRRTTSDRERFLWSSGYWVVAVLLSVVLPVVIPGVRAAEGFAEPVEKSNRPNASQSIEPDKIPTESTAKAEAVRDVPDGFKAFRGRIVDESEAGVEGANVYLEGRNQKVPTAISGRDGWFEMLVPLQPDVRREWVFVRAEHSPTKRIGIYSFQMADDEIFLERLRPQGTPLKPMTVRLLKTHLQPVQVVDKQGVPVGNAFVGFSSGMIVTSATRTDQDGFAQLPVISDSRQGTGRIFALTESHGLEFQKYDPDSNTTVELVLDVFRPFAMQFRCPQLPEREEQIPSDFVASEESFSTEPLVNVPILPEGLRGRDAEWFYCGAFLCSQLCESLCPQTDESGNLTISWMPKWASTAGINYCVADQNFWWQKRFNESIEAGDGIIDRLVELKGKVISVDGKPVSAASVTLQGHSLLSNGYLIPFQRIRMTDDSGKFSFLAPTRHRYMVHAEMPGQVSTAFETDLLAGTQRDFISLVEAKRIVLSFSGTNLIRGCVTSGPDRTPLRNRTVTLTRRSDVANNWRFTEPRVYSRPNAENRIATKVQTDDNGSFSIQAADGSWYIEDPYAADYFRFSASDGFAIEKNFHSDTKTLLQVNTIDRASGRPVSASVEIWGNHRPGSSDSAHLVSLGPHIIQASAAEGTGFIFWDGKSHEITMPLAPRVSLRGQLVNGTGEPALNRSVRYIIYPSVPEGSELPADFSSFISGSISCNEDGSFELKDVIQNCKCEILLTADEGKEWAQQQWDVAATVCPVVSDPIDLGKLTVPNVR